MSRRPHRLVLPGLIAAAFLAGLLLAGLFDLPARSVAQQLAAPAGQSTLPPAVAKLADLSEAFAAVAEQVKPSVVFIRAEREARRMQAPALPPGFERFFPDAPNGPRGNGRAPFQESAGSGFVVSRDGFILTNAHVVDDAKSVTVRLLDRREFKAKVVGTDAATDVAVLKIEATNLTPAPLGDSDAARVGEWVLAVGNPLGENLTFTVTSGILSAKGRALNLPNSNERSIQDFLQTDAAINPGNSGGPLVSVQGRVIGVNSAIASQTGFYSGYGFAIPINLARQVMDQLIAHGRVERAALGVSVRDASVNDAAYVGLPEIRGVLVGDYSGDDSPAKKAGIEPGDIIVAVDGKPVQYVGQLQQRIAFRRPGETVKVEVARKGGARKTVSVKLERIGEVRDVAEAGDDRPEAGGESDRASLPHLGASVVPADADAVAALGLAPERRGPIVTEVDPSGPAAGALSDSQQAPDVILSVEGARVRTPKELRDALAAHEVGDIVSLQVYNAGAKTRRIERIKLAEAPAER